MKKRYISLLLAALLLFMLPAEFSSVPARAADLEPVTLSLPEKDTYLDGQVLVTLASPEDTPLTKEGGASFDEDIEVEASWDFGGADILGNTPEQKDFLEDKTLYVSKVSSDCYSTADLMKKLENKAYVVAVEPDYYQKKMGSTNDAYSDSQWYLDGGGHFSGKSKGIQYSGASDLSAAATPVVAVVDTGIDYTHEDLAGRMWKNPYSSLPGTCGYDFGDNDSDPMDTDDEGHGTHCAGIIGAVGNNGKGIAGISKNVRLMALKVFNSSGKITNSAIVGAFSYIYQAQQLGVNITAVNCSWGGGTSVEAMKTLVEKIGAAGALFVFAAGNDSQNQDMFSSRQRECPYDFPDTYTVKAGASTPADTPAAFSDYGSSSVELFAPGSQILSTVNTDTFFPSLYPAEQQKRLCACYSSCGDGDIALRTPSELGIESPDTEYLGISHAAEDYFGNTGDGSLQVSIRAPQGRNSSFLLYMDVTDLTLDTQASHYVSYDMGLADNGEISWEHYSRQVSPSHFITRSGRTYVRLVGLSGPFYSQSIIYIDNPAISVDNPDASLFGKYSILSGTSMAAPLVTGAVAAMSARFTTDTTIQRKARLLTCTRYLSELNLYCQTSGILDMSKIASSKTPANTVTPPPAPSTTPKKVLVKKVKLNKKKATLRYKKKLKLKAKITPSNATNKKIKWYSSKKKYATVTKNGIVKAKKKGIGHTVKIYARAKDGSKKKAYCKVKIKKKKKQ